MLKLLLRWVLRVLFGFEVFNEGVLRTEGPVLLLANHLSWWDWLFLGVCLESDWRFVTSRTTAELSWLHRWIMVNRRTFPVDMNSPHAVKHIAAYLHGGGRLVLFPEGRMSTTGALMKLFEGTGFLISKTNAKVITAFIRGAGRLPWSPNPNWKEWFPRISVHFSALLNPHKPDHATAHVARTVLTNWLYDVMVQQQFDTEMALGPATVAEAIIGRARGMRRRRILQDATLKTLSYAQLLVGAVVLAARWNSLLKRSNSRVGVVLPNINGTPVVLLSLWLSKKIPAILNYTTGPGVLLACARLAELTQVITSRKFLARAQLDLSPLQAAGIELVFLEDVRAGISFSDRLQGVIRARFPRRLPLAARPDEAALVLFTSGSEGDPKGVELSHRNVLSNIRQMLAVVDLMETERFFNALPLFHSFGLTVGLLLPLIQGNFILLYLSPLHYRIVPAAFYNLNCTVLFGTNTLLRAYAQKAHPYDFRKLRYVFAGAERLQPSTSAEWMHKFGVRILEGYGATECSPCVTVNVPMHSRTGSAGRFLPGIEHRLEPVEGIEDREHVGAGQQGDSIDRGEPHSAPSPFSASGRLLVRGPNIMRGYLNEPANTEFLKLNGWYDTGDIARVDADGYLFLLGRLKRFAKVSGEMISLTAVEDALCAAFSEYGPHFAIAVVAIPDPARGEKIVAVTNEPKMSLTQVREAIHERGLGNLAMPKAIQFLPELPRLSTGKVNHRELQEMVARANHD
jgi:acyl-[acyl-carrier-protein]-phospholipid O-acyltransferase/long-chain-fatty-acid--[acyl-carrier-protein] ligase